MRRATSNICTAQALLAIMAGMYAVYHGPEGIKAIATKVHSMTKLLESELVNLGYDQTNEYYFDTLRIDLKDDSGRELEYPLKQLLREKKLTVRYIASNYVGISLDESTELSDIEKIIGIFAELKGKSNDFEI